MCIVSSISCFVKPNRAFFQVFQESPEGWSNLILPMTIGVLFSLHLIIQSPSSGQIYLVGTKGFTAR
jgi:hypothetical protein